MAEASGLPTPTKISGLVVIALRKEFTDAPTYYVAVWNPDLNAAVLHCGEFGTEIEAWAWIEDVRLG